MEIEKQVVSLELAKKLKELGVKQESFFYWVDAYENYRNTGEAYNGWIVRQKMNWIANSTKRDKIYSAFSVSELGEMLPARNIDFGKGYFESCKDSSGMWRAYWTDTHSGKWIKDFNEVSEADARAKMLIYLIENKLQTIKEGK